MTGRILFFSILLFVLAGCVGDQKNTQAPSQPVINITPMPAAVAALRQEALKIAEALGTVLLSVLGGTVIKVVGL